jgi:hypothetical protein
MKYYAKGIDIDGNEINLTVDQNGNLYYKNKNLVSLETNAKTVYCWNNCLTELNLPNAKTVQCWNNGLTELNLPNAIEVYCQDNCLTSLNLPNAAYVYCENNCLTELNLPNATIVNCDIKCLMTILKLILERSINRTELEMIIHIN